MEGEVSEKLEAATLSVHAMEGIQGTNTIRLTGKQQNRKLLILVDSGSTHSFLDARVAKELKVLIVTVFAMFVTVAMKGKWKVIRCVLDLIGKCSNILLNLTLEFSRWEVMILCSLILKN